MSDFTVTIAIAVFGSFRTCALIICSIYVYVCVCIRYAKVVHFVYVFYDLFYLHLLSIFYPLRLYILWLICYLYHVYSFCNFYNFSTITISKLFAPVESFVYIFCDLSAFSISCLLFILY